MFATPNAGEFDGDGPPERFAVGDEVTVIAGPFKNFDGRVVFIDRAQSLAIVAVPIYGKDRPVPLRFSELTLRTD